MHTAQSAYNIAASKQVADCSNDILKKCQTSGLVKNMPSLCSLQSKGGFTMVGAYPAGCSWDMNYGKSQEEKQKAEANIKKVEVPAMDPVYGSNGPLLEHWKKC